MLTLLFLAATFSTATFAAPAVITACEEITDYIDCELGTFGQANGCKWLSGVFEKCISGCGIPLDTIFVMDTSAPFDVNAYNALKGEIGKIIYEFSPNIQSLFDTRVGIVTYDRVIRTEFSLSTDVNGAKTVMDNLLYYPDYYPSTVCVTGTAVNYALDYLIYGPKRTTNPTVTPLKMLFLFVTHPSEVSSRRKAVCTSSVLNKISDNNVIMFIALVGDDFRTVTQVDSIRCLTAPAAPHSYFIQVSTQNLLSFSTNNNPFQLHIKPLSDSMCINN